MYHTPSRTSFFWHSAGKLLTTYKNYSKSCQIFTITTIKYIFFFELFNMLHAECWIKMRGQLHSPNILLLEKESGVAP
jgi:hypothetical protein